MKEFDLQRSICEYIRYKWKDVIFISDLSGIRLPIGAAKKIKNLKSERGCPDLFIYEPKRGYYGLALEIKEVKIVATKEGMKKKNPIYGKDGQLLKNAHVLEQSEMLRRLSEKGYYACFVVGIDEAMKVLDWYFG